MSSHSSTPSSQSISKSDTFQSSLKALWHSLTRPSSALKSDGQIRQASVLVMLSLALVIIGIALTPLWLWSYPTVPCVPFIVSGLLILLCIVYVLSRTVHYQLGSLLLITSIMGTTVITMMLIEAPLTERMNTLHLLLIAIQLASFLFGVRGSIIVSIISLTGTALLLLDPETPVEPLITHLAFMSVIAALMAAATYASNSNARQLLESEQRFRSLFEQSQDAVFILGLHGEHLMVNHRAADMLGYTVEELLKLTVEDTSAEYDQSVQNLQRLLTGEPVPLLHRAFYKKNGEIIDVEINAELVRDAKGNPLHIQSVARDITERKKTEMLNEALLTDMRSLQAIHLELSEIEDLNTLYYRMVELAQNRLGIDRLAIFLINEEHNQLLGTYGVDASGGIRNEQYYQEPIVENHWSLRILNSPNHTTFWPDATLIDNKNEVGHGWSAASALWTGSYAIGYIIADNLIHHKPPRPYQSELISLLGSTFGHLIEVKQVTAQLRESEERYRTVISALAEGVLMLGRDGKYKAANKAAEEILGVSVDRIINTMEIESPTWKMSREDGTTYTRDTFPTYQTLQTGIPAKNVIMKLHRPDGVNRWLSVNVQPLFTANEPLPYAVVASFIDISERQETEAALKASEARQRALLNAIPDIIFRLNRQGVFLDYHAINLDELFTEPDEFLGERLSDVLPPEVARIHYKNLSYVLDSGKESVYEYTITIHGEQRFMEARMARVANDEVIVILRNVTGRKQAEAQTFELAVERERMKVLSQFVQNASHELRTPLSVINTSIYLMTRLASEEARVQHAEIATRTITSLTRLLDMVLALTKLDSGLMLDREDYNINQLIGELVATDQEYASAHEVRLEFEEDRSIPHIDIDTDWLAESVQHMIENAIQAAPKDSIVLLKTGVQDGYVVVSITDRGSGINDHAMPNIFKRFWRNDEAHSTPGFGLGLPIAQRVIELHGGRIEVESTAGNGSTFKILLPVD